MRLRAATAALVLPTALVVPVVGGVVVAGPAAAAEEDCSAIQEEAPAESTVATRESRPLELMRIREAHEYLRERDVDPGEGATVAVLDSGVTQRGGVRVTESVTATGRSDLADYHGTAVAGLIAGAPRSPEKPVGIAPAAEILDVRVYDSTEDGGVSAAGLAAGLRHVLRRGGVDVVNVSLRVERDDDVEQLVEELWDAGTIVVAAAGNRPDEDEVPLGPLFASPEPGQDAANHVFPAGYDRVVAVSATAEGLPDADESDASAFVLPNTQTDVAAPVVGAVSVALNGGTCTLDAVATSWAAAEVSGVLALLKSLHPDATPGQLVSRLLSTADGRPDVPSPLTGAGVVQPLDALRRPVSPARDGSLDRTTERRDVRAVPPEPEPDTMAGPRREAVWWGLLGGGAVLLALVLRPLLARRSPGR